jgi:(4-O-methyl)-D-glucuronate---lignin esterase
MGKPGQEYFAGTHFNPNVTWWDLATEPIRYFTRCQFMMQQGNYVADALYYYGDHVPNIARLKEDDPGKALPGYDYDIINEDALLSRLTVKEGRITLPQGQSYRLLVLPDHGILSLAALKTVRRLVADGATVLGPKPERTASLTGYPASESELQKLADELWSKSSEPGEHRPGKVRVISGKTAHDVLRADGVLPDCDLKEAGFDYIHHNLAGADYYFVSNQHAETQRVECAFRQSGKQPEIWDPLTGKIWNARTFSDAGGRTLVPLEFASYGSLFIVFQKRATQATGGRNFLSYQSVRTLDGPWEVAFDPKWGGPERVTLDRLTSWIARSEESIRFYSGTAVYRIVFDSASIPRDAHLALGLGDIRDIGIARVRLNGKDLGITWTPPFRLDIPDGLKPSGNLLEVEVINSWRNRLLGDKARAANERFTKTNITIGKDWSLLDSGLLGPVQIFAVSE